MQLFGIARVDAGAEGIHLVWSWPDTLPISEGGFDIQRLGSTDQRWEPVCENIDAPQISYLRQWHTYPAALGLLRLRTGARFAPIGDAHLTPRPSAAPHAVAIGDPHVALSAALGTALAASAIPAAAVVSEEIDEFLQELDVPVERVTIEVHARTAIAIALCAGKVVKVAPGPTLPATLLLEAPAIDMVVVYTVAPTSLRICAYRRVEAAQGGPWASAPYIVKGLTLPIHQTDPGLATPAQEYAAAHARLIAGESVTAADFARLTESLRAPAGGTALGRSGERIVLVRAATDQSFEELPFDTQLAALAIHPRARRMLGFGFRDDKGLVAGATYSYRITGRFRAEDLTDAIYDVHRVPASTVLPAAFTIRDLGLRFQTPVKVVLDPAPAATATHAASRRGIRIDTSGHDASWVLPFYDTWSALITLPRPLTRVVLEVAPGHSFHYAAGLPWAFTGAPAPLPPGPRVELAFPTPVVELRLSGKGTLYAVRIPSGEVGIREVHAYSAPITYAASPLPAAPIALTIENLQSPASAITGPISDGTPVPPRPPVGFKLHWLPATTAGIAVWPDDLEAGPPLDALAYQIEHRRDHPSPTPFSAIAGDDNLTLGSRDSVAPTLRLEYGCDLDALFPRVRPRSADAGLVLSLSDVFGQKDATGFARPAEPLGTYHQYQIRAVDAVGRVSATATPSNVDRLEKHVPPPIPVGPQPEPAIDGAGHLTAPPGPRARAIVRDAPGLTAADRALLGAHQNAIVLEWGWRAQERDLDPLATEFRVYRTVPQDTVAATITGVSSLATGWRITMTTSVALVADELAGQWLTSNDQPFLISGNDAGTAPGVTVERSKLRPAVQPVPGAIVFGRPLRPAHQRPGGWDARVAVYPITADTSYRHVFYDVLTLSASHPRDAVWVGVSAADAQSYVADERVAGANAPRPGNESAIVTCAVVARHRGQPTFSVPPPLGDVPELVTDEPAGRSILVALDLAALLGGALPAGAPVAVARCSSDDLLSRVALSGGVVVLTRPDGGHDTIAFPNPGDHAAVVATLSSADPQRLANRYLLHLVAGASNPASLFERISADIAHVGPVTDRLAPKPGRFLYLVRAADALGHVSDGGAVLPVIVRVPSTANAVRPRRRGLTTTATTATLTVAVPADPDTTAVLMFAAVAAPGTNPPVQGEAELLRIPNRRDLYPADGIRLRLSSGALLGPAVVKSLADGDVAVETDGTRVAALTLTAAAGAWLTLWCFALTRDGVPSAACGPFGTGVRP